MNTPTVGTPDSVPLASFGGIRRDLLQIARGSTSKNGELLSEAEHRLEQIDVLLEDIVAFSGVNGKPDKHGVRVKTYTEMFYYCASRVVDLLELVYGTDSLKKQAGGDLIGVCDVRHNLIEHAHKPKGVMSINWAFDVPQVVVLKPYGGTPNRRAFDKGLRANAKELHDRISTLLQAHI